MAFFQVYRHFISRSFVHSHHLRFWVDLWSASEGWVFEGPKKWITQKCALNVTLIFTTESWRLTSNLKLSSLAFSTRKKGPKWETTRSLNSISTSFRPTYEKVVINIVELITKFCTNFVKESKKYVCIKI